MTRAPAAETFVRHLIGTATDGRIDAAAIRIEQNLYEFGIDSLATVSLVVAIAEEAQADLEAIIDDLETPRTVADLVRLADGLLTGRTIEA